MKENDEAALKKTKKIIISSPCKNGGECKNTASGHRCSCKNDYIGNNCDREFYCYNVHVLNMF